MCTEVIWLFVIWFGLALLPLFLEVIAWRLDCADIHKRKRMEMEQEYWYLKGWDVEGSDEFTRLSNRRTMLSKGGRN